MTERKLILASASPRRRELLAYLGMPFEVIPASVDETPRDGELASALVSRLAVSKAAQLSLLHPAALVLAADTTVAFAESSSGEDILEKPRDERDALRMLRRLSGKKHIVLTAIALHLSELDVHRERTVLTEVIFRPMGEEEIRRYIATGEPLDKAGSYGIQGIGGMFVERINGSYSNVVGLPLTELQEELVALGFAFSFPVERS